MKIIQDGTTPGAIYCISTLTFEDNITADLKAGVNTNLFVGNEPKFLFKRTELFYYDSMLTVLLAEYGLEFINVSYAC
jgi:hypothetical protein